MTEDLSLIKELREKTGAGFLDCKHALKESNNEVELAIDSLRKKGLAKALKKSSREANEGAVGVYSNQSQTIVIKINSETDFSAKSDTFLDFLNSLGDIALKIKDNNLNLDIFLNYKHNSKFVSDLIAEMIAKIGENIIVKQLQVINHKNTKICFYVHSKRKL